jgi:phosphatidylserine/phosphatidylglycerophosphate/cardiolipin synthase-like enzyme
MKILSLTLFILHFSIFGQVVSFSVESIQNSSLSFEIENQQKGEFILHYGKTSSLEMGQTTGLLIENLSPATNYFVQVYDELKPVSEKKLFSTSSKSSGDITIYFNQSVNNASSTITDAITANVKDTIIAYINRAENTLDIANYNTGSLDIVNAINAAKTRGVDIRYIAADNTGTNNDELNNLSSSIPMIQRPNDGEVMHNKFLIIDVADFQKAKVVTGSVNHTENSCQEDFNNLVIVEDQSLANAYKIEFEEMWGSSTLTPNLTLSKFGADKQDNTPHNFNIGGVPVELYFSPSDNVTTHIETAIRSANTEMQFAMLTFINNDLGDAVIDMHDAGVEIVGIIENVFYFGSEYNGLQNAGVEVYSHSGESYVLHHKYGIVDANNVGSDPLIITGSHNWTNSAEEDYDENTLIIHDAVIANMYYEEFMARYQDVAGAAVGIASKQNSEVNMYPNPTSDFITIEHLSNLEIENISIIDSQGRIIYEDSTQSTIKRVLMSDYPKGIYYVRIKYLSGKYYLEKVISI